MLRLKSMLCLDDLFISEQLYHFHSRFNVALSLCMIMTVMLSSWSLPSLLLAFASTKRNSTCASKILSNQLFHMSPPYLPIYGIYLPSLTKTFLYHLKIHSKASFL